MADRAIKRNDTWPPLEATLLDQDGPINLTTAESVWLKMKGSRRKPAPISVSGQCQIVSPTEGVVVYLWKPIDTADADLYAAEFEIRWLDGGVTTVPNGRYFYVDVLADQG